MAVQQLFIPEVALLRDREDAARKRVAATQALPGVRAQDMKLWMPSAIGRWVVCDESLRLYEFDLRNGQAFAALEAMRNGLIVRTHEYHYRDGSLRGVKAKTRSATRENGIQARVDRAADEYQAARTALVSLGALLNRHEWERNWKVLKKEDVRGRPAAVFGDESRRRGGRRKRKRAKPSPEEEARSAAQSAEDALGMSWIWIVEGNTGEEGEIVLNEGEEPSICPYSASDEHP
jgi:hypothetical protein